MSTSSGPPGSSARAGAKSARTARIAASHRMLRGLAHAVAGAEAGDARAPLAHIFVAGGTADHREKPAFSAYARGTSVAAAFPTRNAPRAHATRRGTSMEENAGNLIRGLRQKLGMTQEEFA